MKCAHCKSEDSELFESHTTVTDPTTGVLIRMRSCYYEKCTACSLIYGYRNTEWLDKEGKPWNANK